MQIKNKYKNCELAPEFIVQLLNESSIRAHGGNSAQVAKNQPGLLVVYGGTSTRTHFLALWKFSLPLPKHTTSS